MPAGAPLVHIAFVRPAIGDVAHGFQQLHVNAKSRQERERRILAHVHVKRYGTVCMHRPRGVHAGDRLHRGRDRPHRALDFHRVHRHRPLGVLHGRLFAVRAAVHAERRFANAAGDHGARLHVVRARICAVVPAALPLMPHIAVVVGGRTPDVEGHRRRENRAVRVHELAEQTGALVEHVPPVRAVDHNARIGFLQRHRLAYLVAGEHVFHLVTHPLRTVISGRIRQLHLVEAEFEQLLLPPLRLARQVPQHEGDSPGLRDRPHALPTA